MTMSNFVANLFGSSPVGQTNAAAPAKKADAQEKTAFNTAGLDGENGVTLTNQLGIGASEQKPPSKAAALIYNISQQDPQALASQMSPDFQAMFANPPADEKGFAAA